MADRSPHRSWVFTWNNPPADAYDILRAARARFHACFVGREVGAGGTPHLQGVLISKTPCRLGSLTRDFPGVHFEVMRGTEAQAVEYTKKEGHPDRLDWDDRAQGSRSDLQAMAAIVQANPRTGVRTVATQMSTTFVKYHGGITALSRALQPVPPMKGTRHVSWFFGPTGTGKSHTALDEAIDAAGGDDTNVFRWTVANFKFPGNYAGEEYVIIDELRSCWEHFTFGRLLSLLDRFRCEIEVKGGQLYWAPKRVWITTPLHPQDFVTDEERRGNPECIRQLLRRIHVIREFRDFYVEADAAPADAPPRDICPDSADEGQPLPRAFTPPLPRALPALPMPPTQVSDDESDHEASRVARRMQRAGAMHLPRMFDAEPSDDEPQLVAEFDCA